MNAYELADKLANNLNRTSLDMECGLMLCKQADRIAELEKLVDELAGYKESYENCHRMCNGYGMN